MLGRKTMEKQKREKIERENAQIKLFGGVTSESEE